MPRKKITDTEIKDTTEEVIVPIAEKTTEEVKDKKLPVSSNKQPAAGYLALNTDSAQAQKPRSGYYFAYGRRKTATARARLYLPDQEVMVKGVKLNRGDIYVNNLPIEKYFSDPFSLSAYTEVFRTTNTAGRFITTVIVSGSGMSGQLGATTLAIARALCIVDPKFKTILRKKGYMTRDPRAREREKPGLMGARKQKSSPKR